MKYAPIEDRDWSQHEVMLLLQSNPHRFYENLPSVMQNGDQHQVAWKLAMAKTLLESEHDVNLRSALWAALSILARMSPSTAFHSIAELAWEFIDSCSDAAQGDIEVDCIEGFLNDLRIFAYDRNTSSAALLELARTGDRYGSFTALRTVSAYGPILVGASIALDCASSSDFVIRESGINAMSTIFSRADCEPPTLGRFGSDFAAMITGSLSDSHWYVRKAAQTAKFFHVQYCAEFENEDMSR